MVKQILTHRPVVRQLLTHSDGTGAEAMSDRTRNLAPKHRDAQVALGPVLAPRWPGQRPCY
jgi:hypothetical protein